MAVEKYGDVLPEGVWANALSLTSPKDACRLSVVASTFRDASQADSVWERFLPGDYREILSRAADDGSFVERFQSRKDLYLYLCDHSVLLDSGRMTFSLEKTSGKKCFMLSARELYICWGDTPQYWRWNSSAESRFPEVAELLDVCWLEIKGKISLSMLSPSTNYGAYLIFQTASDAHGFGLRPAEGYLFANNQDSEKRLLCLNPEERRASIGRIHRYRHPILRHLRHVEPNTEDDTENNVGKPRKRDDGWMEVELGEHFVGNDEYGDLEMVLQEVEGGNWKRGLVVEGIEIRPKEKKT